MKKITLPRIFYVIALFAATSILQSSSCSKHDDNSSITQNTGDYSGSWRVSLFVDNGDETSNFNGYTFTFANGGVATATNSINTYTGTWALTSTKFILNFGTTPDFEDLNDDWLIVEKTATTIKVKDDNTTSNERLEFIKL